MQNVDREAIDNFCDIPMESLINYKNGEAVEDYKKYAHTMTNRFV